MVSWHKYKYKSSTLSTSPPLGTTHAVQVSPTIQQWLTSSIEFHAKIECKVQK